eukprot:CAMPEP_0195269620 /NCGR_PEP_ID=MMETSP0706-20130129/13875_1 /TAXON_ID=33640 /ORGANISM="Asterionellopsis glacialis, Strain CCMP134" /LENGTH=388 /DNA_ID=CAMNT_0040324759 /DNA_START=1 /DNA_END=1164 /DNA_ORIENTATION=-
MVLNQHTPSMDNWMGHKQEGAMRYQRGEYDLALASFRASLNPEFSVTCPSAEKQIILSNIVACRLKLGGPAQSEAAVEDAKQCIALNPRWSKGHVRLASAYIALGNHSNDACNSLQRALSIDPGNSLARQMLMRELRRDHIQAQSERRQQEQTEVSPSAPFEDETTNSYNHHSHPTPTVPPEEEDYSTQQQQQQSMYNDVPPTSSSYQNPFGSTNANVNDSQQQQQQQQHNDDLDESLSWSDWIKFYWNCLKTWFQTQPEDIKTIFKLMVTLLLLYLFCGGRFGLGSSGPTNRGNYEIGNAYDRYRTQGSSGGYGTSGTTSTGYSNYAQSTTHDSYDYMNTPPRRRRSTTSSFHMPNLFDGSFTSILVLSGFAYFCHQQGINPFQAIW